MPDIATQTMNSHELYLQRQKKHYEKVKRERINNGYVKPKKPEFIMCEKCDKNIKRTYYKVHCESKKHNEDKEKKNLN